MWQELKDILKKIGGRFIIVEDGKPGYVILSFQEFKNLVNNFPKDQDLEKINEKLSGLGEQGVEERPKDTEVVVEEETTIEDIPL